MLKRLGLLALIVLSIACKKKYDPPNPDSGSHQQDVTKVIRGVKPDMEKCFDEAVGKNPQLSGKIVLVFAIRTDGSVDPKSLGLGGPKGDPAFAQCVLDLVAKQKFPPPEVATDVQMPIELGKHRDSGPAGSVSASASK
jgi:hypothetical protein